MSRINAIARGTLVGAMALLACSDDSTAPHIAPQTVVTSHAPVEVPLNVQFNDINFCTGQIVTYTMTGTARVQQQGDRYLLVARGTVVTSDGFAGTFNRTFIIKGDQVTHLRFHDMETSSATGQRQVFSVGMYHLTAVNGEPIVEFEQFGGGGCPGG